MFTYVDSVSKTSRIFIWDDAGIDRKGRVVLLEEESSGVVPLHVEGHLARLKVMTNKGEPIGKVVWIVNRRDFREMVNLLRFYKSNMGPLPRMEIWSETGTRLGHLD